MKNREKYIDNASNENLVATIMAKISTMPRFSSIDGFTDAGEELIEWLSQEAELSADEMFEELGYTVEDQCYCETVYNNRSSHHRIRVLKDGRYKKIVDGDYSSYTEYITEAEDKAIHKKIEKLKNE